MQQSVVLLRAISNVTMKPFREAMEGLGYTDVESYGMSGNLLFNAFRSTILALEEHPARLKGKRASFDFERVLSVLGTARSSRVVRQLRARMSDEAGR